MSTYMITVLAIICILLVGCEQDSRGINNNTNINNQTTITTNNQTSTNNTQDNTQGQITSNDIQYYNNTTGYFASPKTQGEYPGLILIHEWWGLNENIKATADKLAAQGYNVLAVDLYNGKIATTQQEASALVGALNQSEAIKNMNAAYDYLKMQESTRIGSWGWCFGGGQSMQLALNNPNLSATVIYYGNLETNATKLANITWPIMGVFGANDTSIPVERVRTFESALNNISIENEVYIYPNVGHAFANPTGTNYAPNETQDAWNKTIIFLEKYLKNQ